MNTNEPLFFAASQFPLMFCNTNVIIIIISLIKQIDKMQLQAAR